jgi:alpha-aminoadipate carrier protein LysW
LASGLETSHRWTGADFIARVSGNGNLSACILRRYELLSFFLEAFIMAVLCPECGSNVSVDADEVEEGETVQCEECGMELEVVSSDPLELAPIEEGYDDEDAGVSLDEEEE